MLNDERRNTLIGRSEQCKDQTSVCNGHSLVKCEETKEGLVGVEYKSRKR